MILRIFVQRIGCHPQGVDEPLNVLRPPSEQMTTACAIATTKPWNAAPAPFDDVSDRTFLFAIPFLHVNTDNPRKRKKIINMPMHLLFSPQMSLDPLRQPVHRRPNIEVCSSMKIHNPEFPNLNRGVPRKIHDQKVRPLHQEHIEIDSYKTVADSSLDDVPSPAVHPH